MDERLSLLGAELPASMVRRIHNIEPGTRHDFVADDWQDALVVVEHGEVEVEEVDGTRRRIVHGEVLTLSGMPVRALCNRGQETAVLAAVRRRSPPISSELR